MLAVIIGGALDLNGVHRAMIVTAGLLILGGIVSFLGIRNPVHDDEGGAVVAGPPAAATVQQSAGRKK
jgi:hypothetical protein